MHRARPRRRGAKGIIPQAPCWPRVDRRGVPPPWGDDGAEEGVPIGSVCLRAGAAGRVVERLAGWLGGPEGPVRVVLAGGDAATCRAVARRMGSEKVGGHRGPRATGQGGIVSGSTPRGDTPETRLDSQTVR